MSIKKKLQHYFNKAIEWARPYLTWRMTPFLLVAWLITNGWAYAFVIIGSRLGVGWMTWLGGAWVSILWLPMTPEKLVTIPLAGLLYRLFYRRRFECESSNKRQG